MPRREISAGWDVVLKVATTPCEACRRPVGEADAVNAVTPARVCVMPRIRGKDQHRDPLVPVLISGHRADDSHPLPFPLDPVVVPAAGWLRTRFGRLGTLALGSNRSDLLGR